MVKLSSYISSYIRLKSYPFQTEDDDDLIDKLSRKFSSIFVFVCSIFIGAVQVSGKPITCWCLGEFKAGRCGYATNYCYLTGTYVPIDNKTTIPSREDLLTHRISYYQWVPYIFVIQSVMFYAPHFLWKFLSSKSGFDLINYIQSLNEDTSNSRNSNAIKYVVSHIKSSLDYQHSVNGFRRFKFLNGKYLTCSHILVKCVYALVAFGQLVMLNYWLADEHYSRNSPSLSQTLFGAHNFRFEERFPRTTLCKFSVYIMTDQQTNWVQCTLPLMIFIEKIYIILWTWLWILLALTLGSIVKQVVEACFNTKKYIENRNIDLDKAEREKVNDYLTKDGILMLRIVESNTDLRFSDFLLTNLCSFFFLFIFSSPFDSLHFVQLEVVRKSMGF